MAQRMNHMKVTFSEWLYWGKQMRYSFLYLDNINQRLNHKSRTPYGELLGNWT